MSMDSQARAGRSSRASYRTFARDYKMGRSEGDAPPLTAADEPPAGAGRPADLPPPQRARWRTPYVRAYLQWLRPHRPAIAMLVVTSLAVAGLQMIEPLFMRFIVDRVLLRPHQPTAERLAELNRIGTVFVLVIVLSASLGAPRDYRQRILNARVMLALRRALFQKMLHLPLAHLSNVKTGGALTRLTGDVDSATGLLQLAIVSPAIAAVRLLIAIAILLLLNWKLALVALATIPAAALVTHLQAGRIRPIYRAIRGDIERVDGRVGETFAGIRIVRAFRREFRELLGYTQGRHAVARKELFANRRELLLWGSWGFVVSSVSVAIAWFGGYLFLQGHTTIGDIMAFQWYSMLLLNPVWQIVQSFSELQRSLASTERVMEMLAMPDDKADRPDAVEPPAAVHEIRFEGVEFEYRPGCPVLRDFDLVVPRGAVVALVGRSGAGKTTVTDLVARFHDPTRGRILLNGTDIRQFRLRSYRSLLALVQQDVFLFDGSVKENISYGNRSATDREIQEAARRANAHDFIIGLPQQYETLVGQQGWKLSGGQKQRLAIARAILADPQILILDEATSNLDTESEQAIDASVSVALAGRTTFIVAHRLSTVHRADLILVLDEGRIIERGTHESLMAARGAYHSMVLRQMEFHRGPLPALRLDMPRLVPEERYGSRD